MAQVPQPPARPGAMSGTQDALAEAPLGGTRAQALHRLQIGLGGVLGIVMLVGLVGLIQSRADQTEKLSVPEAAATSQPKGDRSQPDPLMEAGVVPDLPTTPTPTATQRAPILPEQGIAPRASPANPGPSDE